MVWEKEIRSMIFLKKPPKLKTLKIHLEGRRVC